MVTDLCPECKAGELRGGAGGGGGVGQKAEGTSLQAGLRLSPLHPPTLPPTRRRRLLHPCLPRHHRHVAPPPGHPVGVERLLRPHQRRHPHGAQGGRLRGAGEEGRRWRKANAWRSLLRLACPLSPTHPPTHPHAHRPQDGINAQWQAFYFSNARFPLKTVTLNGKPLDRNEFQVGAGQREGWVGRGWGEGMGGHTPTPPSRLDLPAHLPPPPLPPPSLQFWVHAAPLPSGPCTIEFLAENGARLTTTLDGAAAIAGPQVLPNFA